MLGVRFFPADWHRHKSWVGSEADRRGLVPVGPDPDAPLLADDSIQNVSGKLNSTGPIAIIKSDLGGFAFAA